MCSIGQPSKIEASISILKFIELCTLHLVRRSYKKRLGWRKARLAHGNQNDREMMFASPTLTIKPTYLLYFLPPSATNPPDTTLVTGDVVLTLPTPKRVKHIDVQLIGTQSMRCHGRSLSYETIHLTNTLEAGLLEAGAHHFRFS